MIGHDVLFAETFRTMSVIDVMRCVELADAVDPYRGDRWLASFDKRARELGYRFHPAAPCVCDMGATHRPECGLARGRYAEEPDREPAPDGSHRHQCVACGYVWEHPDPYFDEDADVPGLRDHVCRNCGLDDTPSRFHYRGTIAPFHTTRREAKAGAT